MFRLIQKSINQAIAKFQITNQSEDIVGSINVPPEQVDALLRQWSGPVDRRPSVEMSVPTTKFSRPGRRSRQAILRAHIRNRADQPRHGPVHSNDWLCDTGLPQDRSHYRNRCQN